MSPFSECRYMYRGPSTTQCLQAAVIVYWEWFDGARTTHHNHCCPLEIFFHVPVKVLYTTQNQDTNSTSVRQVPFNPAQPEEFPRHTADQDYTAGVISRLDYWHDMLAKVLLPRCYLGTIKHDVIGDLLTMRVTSAWEVRACALTRP